MPLLMAFYQLCACTVNIVFAAVYKNHGYSLFFGAHHTPKLPKHSVLWMHRIDKLQKASINEWHLSRGNLIPQKRVIS